MIVTRALIRGWGFCKNFRFKVHLKYANEFEK